MDQHHVEIVSSAIAGAGLSAALAKAFIAKSLKELETTVEKISHIQTQLAAIAVRLEGLDKSQDLVHKIDRKVIALETKLYGAKHARSSDFEANHSV